MKINEIYPDPDLIEPIKLGDILRLENSKYLYLVCSSPQRYNFVMLVNMMTGNLWEMPVKVINGNHLTKDEVMSLLGKEYFNSFSRVDRKDVFK